MGWAVGWDSDHGRFRGYGVPAYCDAKDCEAEIDRGLGFVCECGHDGEVALHEDNAVSTTIFVCGEHSCADVDEANLPPEHPSWMKHMLADTSWAEWRAGHPDIVQAYQEALTQLEEQGRA